MNVLILGSNSFSGASLVNFLLNRNYNVIGVSRSEELKTPLNPYINNSKILNFRFYRLSLIEDFEEIVSICVKNKTKYIFNFSAQSMVSESWISPWEWYETNIVALAKFSNLLSEKYDELEKFIHFTTPEVYGHNDSWLTENFNFLPTTPYALSRAAGDFHLKLLRDTQNFPVVFTRAANVYGEFQQTYRIIPRTFIYGLTGKKLELHGGGISERSFIHINDVLHALLGIMLNGEIGASYHISTKDVVQIKVLVEKCCRLMEIDLQEFCLISHDRVGKDAAYKLDSTLIRNSLDWKDQITLDKGLEKTYNWVLENLNELSNLPLEYIHKR